VKPVTVTVTLEATFTLPPDIPASDEPATPPATIEGLVMNHFSELQKLNFAGPSSGMPQLSVSVRVSAGNPPAPNHETSSDAEYAEILSCNAVPDHPGLIAGASAVLLHEATS